MEKNRAKKKPVSIENTGFFQWYECRERIWFQRQRAGERRLPFLQHTCFLVFVVCIGSVW